MACLFSFVDFCYSLLCFFFIYFRPNFYDFFPSTNLEFFISSFSSSFRCRVRLLIFPLFLEVACIPMNPPLSTAFTESHRFLVIVFLFSFVSTDILISFWISSVICWLFRSGWHHSYGRKWRRTESLDESERGEWKSQLQTQHSKH